MRHFSDRLYEAIKAKETAICVGLDPRASQIPVFIREKAIMKHGYTFTAVAESFIEFGKGIVDAVFDLVPIVKIQIAFFEQYGHEGIRAFEECASYARSKGLLVIADAKRNDIASTAEAYAKAFLSEVDVFGENKPSFDVDAVTVNAYLGYDGIKPFLEESRKFGKGIFVLVKTSNPSSADLQDRMTVDKINNYELVAHFVESWGASDLGEHGFSCVGVVAGALYPQEIKKLRQILPNYFFLVPGYGAQGGEVEDVRFAFREDGSGAIINSARDIIFAYEKDISFRPEQYGEAAREAVIKMKKELDRK